jgi:hypothetical protein
VFIENKNVYYPYKVLVGENNISALVVALLLCCDGY